MDLVDPLCLAGLVRAERLQPTCWRRNKIEIVVEAAGVKNFHMCKLLIL